MDRGNFRKNLEQLVFILNVMIVAMLLEQATGLFVDL